MKCMTQKYEMYDTEIRNVWHRFQMIAFVEPLLYNCDLKPKWSFELNWAHNSLKTCLSRQLIILYIIYKVWTVNSSALNTLQIYYQKIHMTKLWHFLLSPGPTNRHFPYSRDFFVTPVLSSRASLSVKFTISWGTRVAKTCRPCRPVGANFFGRC